MPARHQPSVSRASKTAVIAGAGVAGLATLFAATPLAQAEPAHQAPVADRQPAATTESTSPSTPASDPIKPDYGTQKYRVGVQVKDGADVPAGTTTAGTKLRIVEKKQDGTVVRDEPCTTVAGTSADPGEATFCPGDESTSNLTTTQKRALGRLHVNVTTTPSFFYPFNYYVAGAGNTVTITQVSVQPNLAVDPGTATISPCTIPVDDELTARRVADVVDVPAAPCLDSDSEGGSEGTGPKTTDVVFDDPGLPPVAGDDKATTKEGDAVTIAIQPNDTPKAKLTSVAIVGDPKHGTARLVTAETPDPTPSTSAASTSGSSGSSGTSSRSSTTSTTSTTSTSSASTASLSILARQPAGTRKLAAVTSYRAIYTPAPGFVGVDTFDYTIATANGSATAKVTVTVTGTAVDASETSQGVDAESDDRGDLADTGTQSGELLGYAALLLAAGGGALAVGRQRRRGRHAR